MPLLHSELTATISLNPAKPKIPQILILTVAYHFKNPEDVDPPLSCFSKKLIESQEGPMIYILGTDPLRNLLNPANPKILEILILTVAYHFKNPEDVDPPLSCFSKN